MENICTETYFSSIFLSTSRVASLACTSYITGASRFEKKSKYLKSNFSFFSKSPYLNIKEFQNYNQKLLLSLPQKQTKTKQTF